jgi:hypothetical protein
MCMITPPHNHRLNCTLRELSSELYPQPHSAGSDAGGAGREPPALLGRLVGNEALLRALNRLRPGCLGGLLGSALGCAEVRAGLRAAAVAAPLVGPLLRVAVRAEWETSVGFQEGLRALFDTKVRSPARFSSVADQAAPPRCLITVGF